MAIDKKKIVYIIMILSFLWVLFLLMAIHLDIGYFVNFSMKESR